MDIIQLQEQVAELEGKWKRALADYQNLEKRVAAEKAQFVKIANALLIEKLLTVVDNLERAVEHLQDKGLSLVMTQLDDIFKSEGVGKIEAAGREFDPQTMECVERVTGEKDRVIEVVEKGYTMNGVVLRPAKVKVGDGEKN